MKRPVSNWWRFYWVEHTRKSFSILVFASCGIYTAVQDWYWMDLASRVLITAILLAFTLGYFILYRRSRQRGW